MASKPNENTVASATFAPFKLVSTLLFSLTLLWFTSVAVHIAWVNFNKLPVDQHMESLIGYYVDKSASKGLIEEVATKTYWLVFEATSLAI